MLYTLALLLLAAPHSDIDSDEAVVFFPTYGSYSKEAGKWTLPIHGRIFEAEKDSRWRRGAVRGFATLLGLTAEETDSIEFQSRAGSFLVDNERGQEVLIRLGDRVHSLEPSGANGHFQDEIELSADEVLQLTDAEMTGADVAGEGDADSKAGGRPILTFEAVLDDDDERRFTGEICLIGPTGISVISDIDDTIKHSQVTDRRALVLNTFVRPFKPVPGMADAYQKWAERGAAFHYVSGSPWQLYDPLREFCRTEKFPPGSFHLKMFRISDASAYQIFASQEQYKTPVIEKILRTYPDRKFILVGDSGEKDPQIYADLAKRFPEQIQKVFIRDVGPGGQHTDALRNAFRPLPKAQWTIFTDPAELQSD